MTYRELKDASYTTLRKDLINKAARGGNLQKGFLEALKDGGQFVEWFEGRVEFEDGEEPVALADSITEGEFTNLPISMEHELFEKWADLTPAKTCRVPFWGYVTFAHIKGNKIEPSFLAAGANGGDSSKGLAKIDAALKNNDEKAIDGVVRTALRRLSGLPEPRGNRTVYVDCPFGRAWWRGYIAKSVCDTTGADYNKVMGVLWDNTQDYWETLISTVVSKNSVFGDENIRSSLIWALSEKSKEDFPHLFDNENLVKIIKKIGVRLAWQELAIFTPEDLRKLFDDEFLV